MSYEHERTERDETEPQATPDEQPSEPKTISRRECVFWTFAALGAAVLAVLGAAILAVLGYGRVKKYLVPDTSYGVSLEHSDDDIPPPTIRE